MLGFSVLLLKENNYYKIKSESKQWKLLFRKEAEANKIQSLDVKRYFLMKWEWCDIMLLIMQRLIFTSSDIIVLTRILN